MHARWLEKLHTNYLTVSLSLSLSLTFERRTFSIQVHSVTATPYRSVRECCQHRHTNLCRHKGLRFWNSMLFLYYVISYRIDRILALRLFTLDRYTFHRLRLNIIFVNRKTLGNIGFSYSNQSRANVLVQRCVSVLSQPRHPTNPYVTLLCQQ